MEIIFCNDILPQVQYVSDLVSLLGLYKNFYKKGDSQEIRTSTYLNIKYFVSKWTIDDFKAFTSKSRYSYTVELNELQLELAKEKIINFIDKKFRDSGHITNQFTRFNQLYSQQDIQPEISVISELYNGQLELMYIRQKLSNPNMLIKDFKLNAYSLGVLQKEFGFTHDTLLSKLRDGGYLDISTVETIIESLKNNYMKEFGYLYIAYSGTDLNNILSKDDLDILSVYEYMLDKVYEYSEERGLSLFMPDGFSTSTYDSNKWNDDRVKAYHIVFSLCQFLGFDPLFFEELDKEIFPGRYRRHHYRDSINRKQSNNVQDIILTDIIKHGSYEQYSEGYLIAVMNSILEVMYKRDVSGKNYLYDQITPAILKSSLRVQMQAYYDNSIKETGGPPPEGGSVGALIDSVWNRWSGVPASQTTLNPSGSAKFRDQLKELNIRRDNYLKSGNFKEFLSDKYNMGPSSSYIKNARDFQILLGNKELGASMLGEYVDQRGFDFMRRIFSSGGFVQTQLTVFTDLMVKPQFDYIMLTKTRWWI